MKRNIVKVLLIAIIVLLIFNVTKVNAIVTINDVSNSNYEYDENMLYHEVTEITGLRNISNNFIIIDILFILIIFIVSIIKKYSLKVFKRSIIIFLISVILQVFYIAMLFLEYINDFIPYEVVLYIIIVLRIIVLIYPIYTIINNKKQNSLKGENKNV